jgi:hypothetical protein
MRVAELDVRESNEHCPDGFERSGDFCRRDSTDKCCTEVNIGAHGLNYSQICGKIIGERVGSLDGFASTNGADGIIDSW